MHLVHVHRYLPSGTAIDGATQTGRRRRGSERSREEQSESAMRMVRFTVVLLVQADSPVSLTASKQFTWTTNDVATMAYHSAVAYGHMAVVLSLSSISPHSLLPQGVIAVRLGGSTALLLLGEYIPHTVHQQPRRCSDGVHRRCSDASADRECLQRLGCERSPYIDSQVPTRLA